MKKLKSWEERDALDFFRKHNIPEAVNFNPEHNQKVIDRTIKKNEAVRKKKRKEFKENLGEKIEAVAFYLKSRAVDSGTPIDKYVGKRWIAKLRGEEIRDILMSKQ